MSVTDINGGASALGTFTRVQNTAPLQQSYLSIVRENQHPGVGRQRKAEQTTEGLTALYVRLSNEDAYVKL